jgi:hypothetical protein
VTEIRTKGAEALPDTELDPECDPQRDPQRDMEGRFTDLYVEHYPRVFAELQQLPTDPAALKARLLATYAGHGTEANDPMGESQWLFTIVSGLVTDMPVSGPVRAAAFRVLADLPGTRLVPVATDALGRTGTAVTLTDAPIREGAVLQSWLIIDPRTSTALAQESHVVKAGGQQAGLAGTRWYSAAVQSSGWTDQAPPR